MSKRILILRKELQNLKKQSGAEYQGLSITLDFSRTREDTERLTGFPDFLSAIHEIAPDNVDWWELTEEQIQLACDKSGLERGSIILENEPQKQITIHVNNGRYS